MDQQFIDISALSTFIYRVRAWAAGLGWKEGIPAYRVMRTWICMRHSSNPNSPPNNLLAGFRARHYAGYERLLVTVVLFVNRYYLGDTHEKSPICNIVSPH